MNNEMIHGSPIQYKVYLNVRLTRSKKTVHMTGT
jgi:hypothetical protein